MFICATGHTTEPHVPMIKIVTERRDRVYKDGSIGWEVAREQPFCPECLEAFTMKGKETSE